MTPRHWCRLLAKMVKPRYKQDFCSPALSYLATAHLSSNSPHSQEKNILLMGLPGAGKTTVGRILSQRLGIPVVDIDDDVLEKTWGTSVAEKLAEVGGERFLEEEGQAVCNFSASGCVISLSGSNPLHSDAMLHLKRSGLAVYIDVDIDDIIARLSRMKVNRIVGQCADVPMRDILQYRKQFYERWLDMRVFCGKGDSIETVVEKVIQVLARFQGSESETFTSTRSCRSTENKPSSDLKFFSDVIVEGLAPDRGLYIPNKEFPKLEPSEWLRMANMSYPERALVILEKCIHPMDVTPSELLPMVYQAYGENFARESVAPVKHLAEDQFVLELFHGPTASFKDLALQLMPQLFAHCLPQMCNYLILVATSGDTGSAVLSGFSQLKGTEKERIGLMVFFPEEGVSPIQKLQMTCIKKGNVRSVSILSDFDFCQKTIKRMFGDSSLTGHLAFEYATVLSTANSINWARLLPQVIYHCSAYLDLLRNGTVSFGDPIDICIPTGNFGNAMSAIYAKQMGIPIRNVICASNQNCVISDFISTGCYDLRGRSLIVSNSPAIDILKSSNLERFVYYASGRDGGLVRDLFLSLEEQQCFTVSKDLLQRIQEDVQAGWCSEEDCMTAIHEVYSKTGYIMDTHTAVGKVVADRLHDRTCPLVLCSTAHYGKFAPAVLKALHSSTIPDHPLEQLNALSAIAGQEHMHKALYKCLREGESRQHTVCRPDYDVLADQVESMIHESFLKVM
ncbi:threonine synthase-like 1 [Hoplias malabaricus]|uniref:threonine synthase-like 1 n=1 Tax=Hoplias malabaricus TaxID=27720 RepID=UPI003462C3CB